MFHRTEPYHGATDGSTDWFTTMGVEGEPHFNHPAGFVPLRERHRVKATGRCVVNAVDRRCRIRKVRLK